MICVPYYLSASLIPNAGKGVFITQSVSLGRILTAPTEIPNTVLLHDLLDKSKQYHLDSAVRWFENHCSVSPEWPDECYINHSFEPTGLWHLGFIFAIKNLPANTEITVDYRHLIAPNMEAGFCDSITGNDIIGFEWLDSLRITTAQLNQLLNSSLLLLK
jgi:hypothetical protein